MIDDNPSDRALVIRQLQREFAQLQVQEIQTEAELEQVTVDCAFDVVVTDYQLRWNNGIEVLRRIKDQCPYCPVIMFTNTGNQEIAVEAMKSGLDDYIIKDLNRYIRLPASVRLALERADAKRQAALLEIRFQLLLDRLDVGVFRSNAAGQLLECNRAFLELLGVGSLEEAQTLQPLDLQAGYTQLLQLPTQSQIWEQQWQPHSERQRPGKQRWMLVSTVLVQVNGETVLDGLLEDITDRKQADLERQQLNQLLEERVHERTIELSVANQDLLLANLRLQEANQDLESFAYSISHDLQEPLRIVYGFATAVLSDYSAELSAAVQDYLERILANAERANLLIQELLNYSRFSRADLSLSEVNLASLLAEVLQQLQPTLEQQQAQVAIDSPLPPVIGNWLALSQVLTNLLTNAIKFVPPEVQPQIRIWAELRQSQPQPFIRLSIADNGIGIPPADQEQIFNVFSRLHSLEEFPGTGIGLAIVRRGVQKMKGRVGVESQTGQGSRFWIELPAGESA